MFEGQKDQVHPSGEAHSYGIEIDRCDLEGIFKHPLISGRGGRSIWRGLPDWQYHLRELAALGVEDERLTYLAGYLRRF
jgi:hypothetical protein